MKIRAWAGAVLVAAGLCGVAAVPAAAAAPVAGTDRAQVLERPATSMRELRQQIDLQLELTPGGRQTAVNEVSYDGGTFVVTYPMPYAAAGVPNCPSGWFCFYDGTQYNGARGKLSDCGWQNLEDYDWIDRTESVHNNTEWVVKYHNHMDYGDPSNGHSFDWHPVYQQRVQRHRECSISQLGRPRQPPVLLSDTGWSRTRTATTRLSRR